MKKSLGLLVLISAYAHAADKEQNKLIKVKFHSSYATPQGDIVESETSTKYPQSVLSKFITLRHLFGDIAEEEERIVPLTLENLYASDFEELLNLANGTQHELSDTIKKDINKVMNLLLLAIFLDPLDKKTLYPFTLVVFNYINQLSNEEGTTFLQRYKGEITVELINNLADLINDREYQEHAEAIRKAIQLLIITPYLKNTVRHEAAVNITNGVKWRAAHSYDDEKLYERINTYLYNDPNSKELYPLVPQGLGKKPKEDYFPISMQDLKNARVITITRNTQELDLYTQDLTFIEPRILNGLPNLREIYLTNNKLRILGPGIFNSLPEKKEVELPLLHKIYLGENRLQTLIPGVFDNLPNLQKIDLNHNQLKTLTPGLFDNLPNLQEIDLAVNQLQILELGIFNNLPSLKRIILDKNKLQTLTPGIFNNLPNLKVISLDSNQLQTLTPGVVDNLPNLLEIYLPRNRLQILQPGVFSNLPALERIVLSHNQLHTIEPGVFDKLPALTTIFLSNNKLYTIEPGVFDGLPALRFIDLSGNQLNKTVAQIRAENPTLSANCEIRIE